MSTAVANAERKPLAEIQDFLGRDAVKKQLALALPKHMTPDRMVRLALSAASRNPLLIKCTPESIGLALMNASEAGIEPDGRHGHLVPYKNNKTNRYEAQFIPDYKGFVKLAYQSGMVNSCMARAVFEKDKFDFKYGTKAFIDHTPSNLEDRGPLTHAWAMVELKEGGSPFVVLNRAEVMQHKKASKSADSSFSPWKTAEPEMWAKTAFRVLSKFIPLSAELSRAIAAEDELDLSDMQPAIGGGQRVSRSTLGETIEAEVSDSGEEPTDPFAWCKTAAEVESVYQELREAQGGDPMEPGTDELETARVVATQRVAKK